MVSMRYFPVIAVALSLCWLAPAPAWAQQLDCKPCHYGFGDVQVKTSSSYSFTLSNTGSRTLRIISRSEQGSSFSLGKFPVPISLQPGQSVELPVTFTPTNKGYADGIITLKSSDANSPHYLRVHGTGFYPNTSQLKVAPATLNFGNVTVGSSTSLQATLTASNGSVTISSDQSTSSEFAILNLNLPVTISAGRSVPVTIQFTPNASGTASAKAGFTSNADRKSVV